MKVHKCEILFTIIWWDINVTLQRPIVGTMQGDLKPMDSESEEEVAEEIAAESTAEQG